MNNWIKYNLDRQKILHHVKLFNGTEMKYMYPNADSWNPMVGRKGYRKCKDHEVEFILPLNDTEAWTFVDRYWKIKKILDKIHICRRCKKTFIPKSETKKIFCSAECYKQYIILLPITA